MGYYRNGKLNHIISTKQKVPPKRRKISKYLKKYSGANNAEIACALKIPINVVLKELIELEKLGFVFRQDQ
jgi:predicted ArsR family transcriptional regulator